jgi:hypothetical protein
MVYNIYNNKMNSGSDMMMPNINDFNRLMFNPMYHFNQMIGGIYIEYIKFIFDESIEMIKTFMFFMLTTFVGLLGYEYFKYECQFVSPGLGAMNLIKHTNTNTYFCIPTYKEKLMNIGSMSDPDMTVRYGLFWMNDGTILYINKSGSMHKDPLVGNAYNFVYFHILYKNGHEYLEKMFKSDESLTKRDLENPTHKIVKLFRDSYSARAARNQGSKFRSSYNQLQMMDEPMDRLYDDYGYVQDAADIRILDYVAPKQKDILSSIVTNHTKSIEKDSLFKSQIVLVCGHPGVGKTYLSHLISYYTNSMEINIDTLNPEVFMKIKKTITECKPLKMGTVINWDEFDTFLDEYILNEKNNRKIDNDDKKEDDAKNLKETFSQGYPMMPPGYPMMQQGYQMMPQQIIVKDTTEKRQIDHKKIKKHLTNYFDTIYQYDNVIMILITNKPMSYFTENKDLDFLTRSMRIHRMYELLKNTEEENKKIFNDFIRIFKVEDWTTEHDEKINWSKIKLSDLYSIFNFSFGESDKLLKNLRELKLMIDQKDDAEVVEFYDSESSKTKNDINDIDDVDNNYDVVSEDDTNFGTNVNMNGNFNMNNMMSMAMAMMKNNPEQFNMPTNTIVIPKISSSDKSNKSDDMPKTSSVCDTDSIKMVVKKAKGRKNEKQKKIKIINKNKKDKKITSQNKE